MKDLFKNDYEIVGENVRAIRKALGLTQDELAQRCSVNSAKISKIENARTDYMFSTLLEICEGLKCDLIDVIGKKVVEPPIVEEEPMLAIEGSKMLLLN
ncbi:helix-turn-helix transcriptional regulator [Pedobacter gandavensis]|uniref:helix-turn-helix domain-containing protein n=1 Tax=Pedobacter gandavensis TaxID=2679963 RepID=UPI0024797369|nr:helix-turn-helix transcriptional regulator [Pedobacter gandavensis]WGQ10431.1 helix-turn-helix transcriptional regulator [Pedobacter gandavensis]